MLIFQCSNPNEEIIPTTLVELKVKGMHCDDCAKNVENALLALNGVSSAVVSYDSSLAVIEFDDKKVSKRELIARAGTA